MLDVAKLLLNTELLDVVQFDDTKTNLVLFNPGKITVRYIKKGERMPDSHLHTHTHTFIKAF